MHKKDRKSYIMRLLGEKSAVTVAELSEAFQLSEVSVRKLLDTMEKEGNIRRTWGGAVSAVGSLGEMAYEEKIVRHLAEKRAIAQVAYDLINDGDAVYLDSGSTTLQLARLLASGDKRKVFVCTHALNIAYEFRGAEDMALLFIGGAFQHRILACGGGMAREMIGRMHFDRGFLTGSHFSQTHGFTTPNLEEAEVKRAVLSAAKETYMLADYSKYGHASLAQIAPCAEIGTLITDWHAPVDSIERFSAQGMRVLCARQETVR